MKSLQTLQLLLLLFSSSTTLAAFKCEFEVDKIKFNLGPLKGSHSVSVTEDTPPTIKNTTWTINPCEPIQNITSIPEAEQCPAGTQVCGIVTHTRSSEPDTIPKADEVIPIAGDFPNAPAAVIERLKTKTASTEGLLITLAGGEYSGKKQKAVIKFICDQAKTGWEGQDSKPAEDSKIDVLGETSFGRRDDKEEKSLKFVGYDKEVLQLDWRTKYACESTSSGGSAKGGKGFFTWFIIIAFVAIAAYLIFGSWLNYNKYGARGWDLLPHSDTLRDLPYLFRDFLRRIVNTFQGGGSRGGYSAV